MSRWVHFNPNPKAISVGDCAVRAICKAEDIPWEEAYVLLCSYGYDMSDMPSSNRVWGALLRDRGYKRYMLEFDSTVESFCASHPEGTYILALQGHVVCAKDGRFYDTWMSNNEMVVYYWRKDGAPSKME